MSFTNLVPITSSHLLHAQAGRDTLLRDHNTVTCSLGGHEGLPETTVSYIEYLCGDATTTDGRSFTSDDNTTGTLFFPEIQYWTSLHNLSVTNLGALVELEVTAESVTKHSNGDLGKGGIYDPDAGTSEYFHIYHGDEVFGKFNRVAVFKMANSLQYGRLLLTRGPGI